MEEELSQYGSGFRSGRSGKEHSDKKRRAKLKKENAIKEAEENAKKNEEDEINLVNEEGNLAVGKGDDEVSFVLNNFIIDLKKYKEYDARYDGPDYGRRKRSKKKPEIIGKLARGLYMDYTIEQACALAGIVKDTYHRWKNEDPRFALDMKNAKHGQLMVAKGVVFNALKNGDTKVAIDVLSKREEDYKSNAVEGDTNMVLNMNFIDNVVKVVADKRIAQNDARKLKGSEEVIGEVIDMDKGSDREIDELDDLEERATVETVENE